MSCKNVYVLMSICQTLRIKAVQIYSSLASEDYWVREG